MKNIIIILSLFILVSSCTKDINLDNKYAKQKLVVNAILEVDSTMKVVLFKSNLPLDDNNKFLAITDASVILTDLQNNKSNLIFEGVDTITIGQNASFYKSNDIVKMNTNYSLEVETKEYGKASSIISIPKKAVLSNLNIEVNNIKFSINDDASVKNFYMFSIEYTYFNTVIENSDTFIEGPFTEPLYLELDETEDQVNKYKYTEDGTILMSDNFLNGKIIENDFYFNSYSSEEYPEYPEEPVSIQTIESVNLKVSTINEAYYNYLIAVQNQLVTREDPFSEATLITNNIENGIGIFGAKNVTYYKFY